MEEGELECSNLGEDIILQHCISDNWLQCLDIHQGHSHPGPPFDFFEVLILVRIFTITFSVLVWEFF